jgi:hypothetical protein
MTNILNFTTSYNQFYIADSKFIGDTGAEDFWTDNATSDRLAIAKDILGVRTECYGHINGDLVILNQPSIVDNFDLYDHVVEGGLEIKQEIFIF